MSESRLKRLWKDRLSQQITNFHFNSCLSANIIQEEEPIIPKSSTSSPTSKRLWRKPLPTDCPTFNFGSEKLQVIEHVNSLDEKTEIPTRYESRYYTNIPNLEAELDRACKNEKAVLLTKLLQKQRH